MVQVILTAEQTRLVQDSAAEPVQLCDPNGNVLRIIEPAISKESIAELKRRAASPGPWFSSAQVKARLEALQEEWDRIGSFDECYMREYLTQLNESDPGLMLT